MMIPQALSLIQFPDCLICGANASKQKWFTVLPGPNNAGSIFIVVGNRHVFLGSVPRTTEAIPSVCTQCGHVQFFINPEDIQGEE